MTDDEINDILSIVVFSPSIPYKTRQSMQDSIVSKLKNQLCGVKVDPVIIPQLKIDIEKEYHRSKCAYGEAVGILMGQSIGENQTQSTLNSFHAAGITINLVSTGIPRFNELINASASQKFNSLSIVLSDNHHRHLKTPKDVRDYIGNTLKEVRLNDLLTPTTPRIIQTLPAWSDDDPFRIVNEDEIMILCDIDKSIVFKYRLDLKSIKEILENKYEDVTIIYSPLCFLQIVIVCKIPKLCHPDEYIFEYLFPQLNKCLLFGIEGISDFVFTRRRSRENDGWLIQTNGTNFRQAINLVKFDYKTMDTNNLWEVYNTLGIEATREFLFTELKKVLNDGGWVNERHIHVLVDIMTHRGVITSVSRYGSRGNNLSPLSRVSFEETLDNFLRASYTAEFEDLKSISSNVMTGKMPRIGSGFCDIVQDLG